MRRPNWEKATFGDVDLAQLEEKELSWLCGCGATKPYVGSKAYPICDECHQRMRILNHARLGYVTTVSGGNA